MARLRAISCKERMLVLWFSPPFGQLGPSTDSGWALDAVMLERRRIVAKCFMLIEQEGACLFVSARKQVAGPEDYATDPDLRKWAHKVGSACTCAQKVRASCAACPPPDRRARNTVHSDEEAAWDNHGSR